MEKLIFLLLLSISCVYAQNVKVSDYSVPVSSSTDLRLNGFWNWSQSGDSVSGNAANATLLYRKFYSSLPFAWFLNVDASGGKNFGQYSHDIRFEGSLNKYIWNERNWFALTMLRVQHQNSYKQPASDVTVGFGYGRHIDVTALAKAVRIEEHFLRDGIMTEHLPKETMLTIASIIERQQEYSNLYGEIYESRWFDDIENEILRTGLLTEGAIGSVGVLRMRQVLFETTERVNKRFYGWNVSAGTLFKVTTSDKSHRGDPNFTVNTRYSFPLSWRTQINTSGEIFTPMDSAFAKEVTLSARIDFIYELSNRINFVSNYRFMIFKPIHTSSQAENVLNASFLYYIENNIYLGINAAYEKFGNSPRRLSTSMTLSYNFY